MLIFFSSYHWVSRRRKHNEYKSDLILKSLSDHIIRMRGYSVHRERIPPQKTFVIFLCFKRILRKSLLT